MRRFFLLSGAVALALGCGSVVIEPGQTSGTTSGGGGATATTTTSSNTVTDTGVGGGFTTSTGAGGSAPLCDASGLFLDVEGDVPLEHFDGDCFPEGTVLWLAGPNPPPPPKTPAGIPGYLTIDACPVKMAPTLQLGGQSATFPAGLAITSLTFAYADGLYANDPTADSLLDVTTFEPTGGVIEGTFTVTVVRQGPGSGPATLKLTGTFRVCHGPDNYTV